jgi:hypothetical protein
MQISIPQTLNCAVSFTGYMEIQTEEKGKNRVWKDGLQFGLKPDGKSSVGRPRCRWKVMLRAQSV